MEVSTYLYEPYVAILEDGRQALVQIFRDPTTGHVRNCQIAFRSFSWETWGAPYPLEPR